LLAKIPHSPMNLRVHGNSTLHLAFELSPFGGPAKMVCKLLLHAYPLVYRAYSDAFQLDVVNPGALEAPVCAIWMRIQ